MSRTYDRASNLVSPIKGCLHVSGERHRAAGAIRTHDDPHAEPGELERLAYSVDEAATILGIARETIYELIRAGESRSRKASSRRIIGRTTCWSF
jgi:excisionase family DNA binding protein